MGNQASRLDRSSSSATINDDPCLDNMRQWHSNKKDEPYKRQYPLPIIANDHNRIKPRKQSSPAAVTSFNNNNNRKAFTRFFNRQNKTNLPRNNSSLPSLDTESISRPSLESRGVIHSNRNSLNHSYLKLLSEQQEQAYRLTGKRKYNHVTGSNYLLPCDDEEIDRLHLQHFMIRFAIQGNYLAPVSDILRKGGRVLDIGCGPGSWSMEIAGEYPKSTVIGIDITPIYPKEIKPTNCAFYQCNVLNILPFEDNTFDYIFMRFMSQGVESEKWSFILSELVRVLKPNGWIEWIEGEIEIHRPGPVTQEFNTKLLDLMKANNQDPHISRKLKENLTATGKLMNISSVFVSCPGGQWAGKIGQLTMQSWKAYYQALCPLLCQSWGISPAEYNEKLKTCWREADEYKTFENVHFSYAQKRPH
ncbi:hypothetical protein INT48_008419 [Thamnidium elegans]|uniref:Methyltransferase domain-containing protein n=1 Tax=Thamnidium elegans TaxID=101142 RepID=A0A8H7VU16_9FUNG|nr:hypothetical protein INT48_008419 [Thamnidium elegans]